MEKTVVKKVTALHPFPNSRSKSQASDKKLRVAAYCRVSSTSDEQLVSFQNQITYYESYIRAHPDYELAGIFSDQGISGTDLRKREALHRLLTAARDGKIDLIITKSLSRFGRNTLDCLKNIRELRALGVDIYFEKENIHALRSEGELVLTLVAAIAQNESLNQSENVKWGIRRQYERGNIKSVQSSKFLGYEKDKHGDLVIDDKEAIIVRRIYQSYLDGMSHCQIAMLLSWEHVPMTYGGRAWCPTHIAKVLTNEKYQGDTLFQKTFNENFLTKHRVKNTGQLPQYYLENTHPAIIDRETWALVQLEAARQKQVKKHHGKLKYHIHSEDIPLAGKIVCSVCGRHLLLRETQRIASKNKKRWQCNAVQRADKPCSQNFRLDVIIADQALVTAWNELVINRDQLDVDAASTLTKYRQDQLIKLLGVHGPIKTMPYELMLKVLDHIEVHPDYLNVIFLSGAIVKTNLPAPKKPQPRWTHTQKAKTPMALRRMELGLTQEKLAKETGTARAYLNRIENGRAVPSPALAKRLNDILGMVLL